MSIRRFAGIEPSLDPSALIDPSAVVIGDVHIGEQSSVWPLVTVRGDVAAIHIGKRSNIQDNSVLHVTHASVDNPGGRELHIGDDVTVGHAAVLHACRIGNRVLIGMNSTVLDGAIIEDDVILAAHSLVGPGKRLESGYLYVGVPAKQARPLSDKERAFLPYSANNYVNWAKQHQQERDQQGDTER